MQSERPSIALLTRPDTAILDWYVSEYTKQGWRVVNRTDQGVQFQKPKEWSVIGTILFVVFPALGGCFWYPLLGIALIGLVLVLADYLIKKDTLEYVTPSQARERAEKFLTQ